MIILSIESNQAPTPTKNINEVESNQSLGGLLAALAIIGLWVVSLTFLMTIDVGLTPFWLIIPAVLWQIFLYTGLFITAHDAMHGAVFPDNPKINRFIGSFAVLVYGLFSYQKLLYKHWLHHRHPATQADPDFHDSEHTHPVLWYLHFMKGYWSWRRLFWLMIVFNVAAFIFGLSKSNLILFWMIPSILSSAQLFIFGTYLPHREPKGGYQTSHRAQTNSLSIFWSFITCYHFGYHLEHHEFPNVPWWRLPIVHQQFLSNQNSGGRIQHSS
jgi:beta-carotene ketolase (CrtW type)